MTKATATGDLPANVRAEMARRGYTQATLGEAVGLTQFAMSRRLRGEVSFSSDEVRAIAELLEVSISTLYGEVPA